MGATGVFQKTLLMNPRWWDTASKQTTHFVTTELTTELVAAAIHRLGVPSTDSSGRAKWQAPGSWKDTAWESEHAMRAALVLHEVYGEDAVDVYWKVGVLAEDEDARQGVFDVLAANGVDVSPRGAASLIVHAFDALMITEAEKLNRRRAELAEIKAEKTKGEAA